MKLSKHSGMVGCSTHQVPGVVDGPEMSASLTQNLRWAHSWNSREESPDDVTIGKKGIEPNTDFPTERLSDSMSDELRAAMADNNSSTNHYSAGFTILPCVWAGWGGPSLPQSSGRSYCAGAIRRRGVVPYGGTPTPDR